VRYGVTKAEDGGTITISTEETKNEFIITVTGDGAGFASELPGSLQSGLPNERLHIGIEKVRNRLMVMCQGTLDIQGTVAIISIPKKERIYENHCG